jgi:hypothetical protein
VKATESPAQVTFPLSGRQRFSSNFGATALGHYKLSMLLAPLGHHEAKAPALAFD